MVRYPGCQQLLAANGGAACDQAARSAVGAVDLALQAGAWVSYEVRDRCTFS